MGLVEQFSIKGHLEALSSGDLGAMPLNHFDQTNGSILMGEAISWSVGGHQVSLFWRHTITPLAIRSAYGSVKNRVYTSKSSRLSTFSPLNIYFGGMYPILRQPFGDLAGSGTPR